MKKIILFLILISNQLLIAQNTPWDEETPPIILECANGDVFEISTLDLFNNPVVLDSIYSLCGEEGIDEDWNGPDWDDDFWNFDSNDVDEGEDWPWDEDSIDGNNPWGEEDLLIELMCSNGEVYQVNLLDMVDSAFEETITALCGEEGIDEDWNGPDWDDDFWNFDSTDVDNPWEEEFDCINSNPNAYALYMSCMNGDEEACLYLEEICGEQEEDNDEEGNDEDYNCYNDVFPGMDNIDMNTLFGEIEMTFQDIIFIVESSESIISVLNENGINYVPEEIEGYLIFGPFTLEDVYTFFIEGLDDFEIDWGMFRPFNSEIISQGTYSSANNNLPEIFNTSAMVVEDLDQELIIYSTDYYDLMGRNVLEPRPNSIYIELKSTNLGPLKGLKYYCN